MPQVLCKLCVGSSICRSEADIDNLTRCPPGYESVYVPSAPQSETSVFNDTYLLFEPELCVPTHIISYHFDVNQVSQLQSDPFWETRES